MHSRRDEGMQGRWHAKVGILAADPLNQRAGLAISRHNRLPIVRQPGGGAIARIETELCLATGLIGSVAGQAVFREDRPNVTIEVDFSSVTRDGSRRRQGGGNETPYGAK